MTDDSVSITVLTDDGEIQLAAPTGTILRDVLLDAGISPYTRYTERLNCGGRGFCATCGVRVCEGDGREPSETVSGEERTANREGDGREPSEDVSGAGPEGPAGSRPQADDREGPESLKQPARSAGDGEERTANRESEHDPDHWHDRLAARFGYPRLSCQIELTADIVVRIPDKRVWGGREVDQ